MGDARRPHRGAIFHIYPAGSFPSVPRDRLIEAVRDALAKTGFYLSEKATIRGLVFDIVARRDEFLLLIKVLRNVDAFTRANATELRMIATTLEGAPLVIGERSASGKLEEGVVYSRFGVPIIAARTFVDFFEDGVPPFMFSAPGGLYVRLDGERLRKVREERQISLGALAEVAGVSRRTIQMYLDGMSATIDMAMRLEEFLGEPLVLPVDPFVYTKEVASKLSAWDDLDRLEKDVFRRLEQLGYGVQPTIRCPFEAFTTDKELILLTAVVSGGVRLAERAGMVASLSRVTERDSVLFVDRETGRRSLRGTPLIARQELRKIRDRSRILEIIEERKT